MGNQSISIFFFFLPTIHGCCHVVEFKCSLNMCCRRLTQNICSMKLHMFYDAVKAAGCPREFFPTTKKGVMLCQSADQGNTYWNKLHILQAMPCWFPLGFEKTRMRWKTGRWGCGQNLIMPNYQRIWLQIELISILQDLTCYQMARVGVAL